MARAIPRVEGARLISPAEASAAIAVGTPAWYVWLDRATSFAFVGVAGHFTARKERRRQGDGYWKAYRKRSGVLRSVYLGRSSDLTLDRLNTAAASLAVQPSSTPAGLAHPNDNATTSTSQSAITLTQTRSEVTQPPLAVSPLLRTKLFSPPARPNTVARPRLIARVQSGLMGKLLLLAAPAGFGKTTLLVQGLAAWRVSIATSNDLQAPSRTSQAQPVAWVSVDRADNDPLRFWRYVSTALDTIQPGCGATALSLLATPEPPIETVLTALLNDLSVVPLDTALVLDDYHLIDTGPIHQAMTFLLDHLPPQLHVIIATRTDPPLPLTRLRARHDVTELRATDLRFTLGEATSFLRETMALPLVDEDIVALEARTEGWIAGLQLAALALRDRTDRSGFVQAFRGSNRFVVDYLGDEVLDQLPAHLLSFLLQTAILDRMCGSLCDAILGLSADDRRPTTSSISSPVVGDQSSAVDAYSQLILEQLERANLFVVPLDDERHWYRYHPLFAEVLRQRLQSGAEPATVARLHGRASTWFAQQGLLPEAIQYAFAGHDSERAAQLVELAGPDRLASGEVTTVRNWLTALPENLSRARPRLGLLECWTLAFSAQFVELDARLYDVMRALATATELVPTERRALASEATVLRTRVAFSRNEIPPLGELRQALLDTPENDLRLRSLILLALGHAERLHGNGFEASHAYGEANRLAQRAGDLFTAGSAVVALAEHYEVRGQLHAAAEIHRQGLQLATARDGRPLPLAGFFHVGLGKQLREWNDLDAAVQHLQQGIALGQQGGIEGIALDGAITLTLVLQAQGDSVGAERMLERAAEIAQTWNQPQIVLRVATFAARLALMRGHVADATRWVRTNHLGANDELSEWLEIEYCTLARWQIAERHADDALRLLRQLAAAAELAGRMGRLIEIRALQALAYQAQSETAAAVDHLARALALAAPERYVRVFADEGAPMAALLRAAYARRIMPDYVATLLAAFPQTMNDEERTMKEEPLTHRSSFIAQPWVEPLTARELDVLRLVVAGRSNRAIASELIVAVGTVKAHLNSIFGKLGVTSRTQAIMRANDLHLV
jgi:LuxR family maltose regulon positive regulatory protein